ncbi:MAG: hypothetical protein GQ532_12580 [Methylomarinum sp.]|nr:hypothetical protein [Methylomarinum sp.]
MKQLYVPYYAEHLTKKLSFVLSGTVPDLEEKQLYGVLLASAYSTHNDSVIENTKNIAKDFVDESTINAALSAAVLARVKFEHKGLPSLESEIKIDSLDEDDLQAIDVTTEQASACIKNQKDDTDFQLFLLAASFINNFDNYLEMLVQQNLVSKNAINTVVQIAALIQSIAEMPGEAS